MKPAARTFPGQMGTAPTETNEAALLPRPGRQLYAGLGQPVTSDDGRADRYQIRLWWKPLVWWIWLGGGLIAIKGQTGAAGMRVLIGDGAEVAAAAPFSASISGDNEGSGTVAVRTNPAAAAIPAPAPSSFVIQAGAGNISEIIDAADTAVPPTVLARGPYAPGAWIPVHCIDVQLSGSLQPGDSFTVQPTPAGMAYNGNIRALIDTRLGNPGFEGKFTREVTRVATNLSDTTALATAAQAVRDKALEARDSASAVNLDEEAAELIRFQ